VVAGRADRAVALREARFIANQTIDVVHDCMLMGSFHLHALLNMLSCTGQVRKIKYRVYLGHLFCVLAYSIYWTMQCQFAFLIANSKYCQKIEFLGFLLEILKKTLHPLLEIR
ncbi:hypothetical protein, partial [Niveispirillum sp. KHB5.9]|uniref:hypothetical protein n=1 Tax=Niveispirillum sp. KHB5.9 TaxID=3400269 RepID=UPI003A8AB60F